MPEIRINILPDYNVLWHGKKNLVFFFLKSLCLIVLLDIIFIEKKRNIDTGIAYRVQMREPWTRNKPRKTKP